MSAPQPDPPFLPRSAGARPPRELLFAACGSVLIGAALLFAGGMSASILGYLLSSFLTIGFVSAYQRVDLVRRSRPGYEMQPTLRRLSPVVTLAGILVASAHVWRIATELAG